MPSGATLALNSDTLKVATEQLVRVASDPAPDAFRWLLTPDNMYVKGCLDAATRFLGQDGHPDAIPGWPPGVTTRPEGGSC